MSVGPYISGVSHLGLIAWLAMGWGLASDPLEFDVTEVTIISGDAFDAALRAGAPMAEVESSPTPVVFDAPTPQPTLAPEAPLAPVAPTPEPPPPEATPAPAPTEAPAPLVAPPAPPAPPAAPAPPQDVAPQAPEAPVAAPPPNLVIDSSPRPRPRPSQRIAARPVAPTPDAAPSDLAQDAPTPNADATEARPEAERTAPPEAADRVAIADEAPSGAPEISLRPQARPARAAPATAQAEPDASAQDAVASALAAALASGAPAAPAAGDPQGQSLSSAEIGSFLGQIGQCWNMAAASTDAQNTTVSLQFRLTPEGRLEPGSLSRAGYRGGDARAAEIAYRVAEQAVTECQDRGRNGYGLPPEKYTLWQELKIHFNPETMRLR